MVFSRCGPKLQSTQNCFAIKLVDGIRPFRVIPSERKQNSINGLLSSTSKSKTKT